MANKLSELQVPEGVDQEKANRLINWIVSLEADNDKTGRYTDTELIHKIGKQIQGDVKCL